MSLKGTFEETIKSAENIKESESIIKALGGFLDELEKKYNIQAFTELQKAAFKDEYFWAEDKNAIILGATSSGKTLAAEFNMERQLRNGKNVIYLVPLRALTTEKMRDFEKHFDDNLKIYSSSSDYQEYDYELSHGKYDIGVLVYEKFFALYSQPNSKILNKCGLIVVDEMHMIGDEQRGPKLEFALERVRYSEKNPPAILGLSTSECDMTRVQKWLGGEEKTRVIFNDSRPVEIEERFLFCSGKDDLRIRRFRNGEEQMDDSTQDNPFLIYEKFISNFNSKSTMLFQIIKNHQGDKIIIFCSSKRNSEKIAKDIVLSGVVEELKNGASEPPDIEACDMEKQHYDNFKKMLKYGVAYHNAGLTLITRSFIEENFQDGNINIIVATDTLTMGINLPADIMVIYDYIDHEDKEIGYMKYKNIIGRAGRMGKSKGDCGISYVLSYDARDVDKSVEKYAYPKGKKVIYSGLPENDKYAKSIAPYFLNVLCAKRAGKSTSFSETTIRNIVLNGLHKNDISEEQAKKKALDIMDCLLAKSNNIYVSLAREIDDAFSEEAKYEITIFGKYMAPFALKLQTCALISRAFIKSEAMFKKYCIPECILTNNEKCAFTLEPYDFCVSEKDDTDKQNGKDKETTKPKCFLLNMLYSVCYYAEEICAPEKTYLVYKENHTFFSVIQKCLKKLIQNHKNNLCSESKIIEIFLGDDSLDESEVTAMYRAVVLYFWLIGMDVAEIRSSKLMLPNAEQYYIYTSEVRTFGEVCAYIFEAISQAFAEVGNRILKDKLYGLSICLKYGMNKDLARIANKHIHNLSCTRLLNIEKYALKNGYEGVIEFIDRGGSEAKKRMTEEIYNALKSELNRIKNVDNQQMFETLKREAVIDDDFSEYYDTVKSMNDSSIKAFNQLLLLMGTESRKINCIRSENSVRVELDGFGEFVVMLRVGERQSPNDKFKTLVVYSKEEFHGADTERCKYIGITNFLSLLLKSVYESDKMKCSGNHFLEKLKTWFMGKSSGPSKREKKPLENPPASRAPAELTQDIHPKKGNGNITVANMYVSGDVIFGEKNSNYTINLVQLNQYNQWVQNIDLLKSDDIDDEDDSKFFEEAEKQIEVPDAKCDIKQFAEKLLAETSNYSLTDILNYANKLDGNETRILQALYVEYSVCQIENLNDYSPIGVLYGKAVEDYAKKTVLAALRKNCPNAKIYDKDLKEKDDNKISIGNIAHMVGKNANSKLRDLNQDAEFWNGLSGDLDKAAKLRNPCCHSQPFNKENAHDLREITFEIMKKVTEDKSLSSYIRRT